MAACPLLSFLRKAFFSAAFLVFLTLTSCSSPWVTETVTDYLKKKTGLEVKVKEVSFTLKDLAFEMKGLSLNYKKGPSTWEITAAQAKVDLNWYFAEENLPWPSIKIKTIAVRQPVISARLPETKQKWDWVAHLKKLPDLEQVELSDLQGRILLGSTTVHLSPGTVILISFSPDQGGKLQYQVKEIKADLPLKKIHFRGRSRGIIELLDFPDQPRWNGSLKISDFHLADKGLTLTGSSGTLNFKKEGASIHATGSQVFLNRFHWSGPKGSIQASGMVALSGSFQGIETDPSKGNLMDGRLDWDDLDFEMLWGDRKIAGLAQGWMTLDGPLKRPRVAGRIRTVQTRLDLLPISTAGLEADLPFQGSFPDLSFSRVQAQSDQCQWRFPTVSLMVLNPETRFKAQILDKGRQIRIGDISLKTKNWGTLGGHLLFEPLKGPAPQGWAYSRDFPIRQASGFFSPSLARIFPDEIPGQGDLTWSWDRTAATVQFQLSLNPPALQAGGQGRMWEAENLQTEVSLSGQWFPREKRWEITGTQQVKAGTLALAPWIFPFDRDPLQAEFRGSIEHSPGSSPGSRLEGSLNLGYAPLGKLQASGLVSFLFPNWTYAGSLELNELPTETAYPLLVAGPLALEHPFLEKVFLQGSLRARLQVGQTDKENSLQGRISSPGLKITTREPSFYLEDLAFDLPFQFSSGRAEKSLLPPEAGFLRIGDLQGPGLSAQGLTLPVRFESDRLEVPGDITLSLWGGEATLKDLRVDHLLTKPTLLTALFLKNAELDRLFPNKRVAAKLNGAFDPVVVSAEKASFKGVLRAELFDGQVEGTHWVIRQPFSRDRRIQADLSFSHLNLEPITRLFSFGQVTGYIQGTVNDLSVYDNQPEGFDLSLETEEVKGVPKKIALKAVENISLLGTGSGDLDVLSRGINRWIREYEYGSIGISCRLRGDRLQLRGTIIEEGVEYLVRKSGWSGIDVINKNPDNEIEFSDILERIKRMGRNHPPGGAHENH